MIRYIGEGSWLPGVPARDLTNEEYAQHKEAINANERATGRALYVKEVPATEPDETISGEQADREDE